MEVVIPLGIETISAHLSRIDDPHIVQIALRDHVDISPQSRALTVDRFAQFLEKVVGAEVEDAMNGIDSQGINMKLCDPVEGVAHEIMADPVA
ncbi:MAG: hypothetical protein A4E62_01704 [Syntrophorhabdus sp. PtaU1.Bin002]|nr:MAG: hypothetical protein A4E62_01704 [Syntrophorhabdus sp. PtaU1.Bin002]